MIEACFQRTANPSVAGRAISEFNHRVGDMDRLTSQQIDHLTALMDERYRREMEDIGVVTARSQEVHEQDRWCGNTDGRLERTLADIALEADAAVAGKDAQAVRDIIAARRRLAAGTYGVCIECGDAIGYRRLLAYPTAKRCIECQREHERERERAARAGRGAA